MPHSENSHSAKESRLCNMTNMASLMMAMTTPSASQYTIHQKDETLPTDIIVDAPPREIKKEPKIFIDVDKNVGEMNEDGPLLT